MNRSLPTYGVKTLDFKMHDYDQTQRIVKGYLSAFNVIDSDSDIIMQGAFSKSIAERGPLSQSNRKIAHLRNHDWSMQIGRFLELQEDEKGLLFTSQMGRSTAGSDAFLDYQDGIIREHSIGFQYLPDKMRMVEDAKGTYFEVSELILWEGSAVTFGANEFTPVLDVTKGNHIEQSKRLHDELIAVSNALKNGKGTDERLHSLEMRLKVIAEKYNSLIEQIQKPPAKALLKQDQPIDNNLFTYLDSL